MSAITGLFKTSFVLRNFSKELFEKCKKLSGVTHFNDKKGSAEGRQGGMHVHVEKSCCFLVKTKYLRVFRNKYTFFSLRVHTFL